MESAAPVRRPYSLPVVIAAAVSVLAIVVGLLYLSRSVPQPNGDSTASQEAKAYVRNLQLSDVTMQATENFMEQRVVEVQGKIANQGPRPLRSVDVFCLFQGIDGRQIGRQRLPIVGAKNIPLKPGESRPFRLPFDSVPEGWNQAMPRMVIADISFAQ